MKFRPLSTFRKKDNTKKEAVPKAATKQRNGKKKKSPPFDGTISMQGIDLWKADLSKTAPYTRDHRVDNQEIELDDDFKPWETSESLENNHSPAGLVSHMQRKKEEVELSSEEDLFLLLPPPPGNQEQVVLSTPKKTLHYKTSKRKPFSCTACKHDKSFTLCQKCYGDEKSVNLLIDAVATSDAKYTAAQLRMNVQKSAHHAAKKSVKYASTGIAEISRDLDLLNVWCNRKIKGSESTQSIYDQETIRIQSAMETTTLLTLSQLRLLKQLFYTFDIDCDGQLSLMEFQNLLNCICAKDSVRHQHFIDTFIDLENTSDRSKGSQDAVLEKWGLSLTQWIHAYTSKDLKCLAHDTKVAKINIPHDHDSEECIENDLFNCHFQMMLAQENVQSFMNQVQQHQFQMLNEEKTRVRNESSVQDLQRDIDYRDSMLTRLRKENATLKQDLRYKSTKVTDLETKNYTVEKGLEKAQRAVLQMRSLLQEQMDEKEHRKKKEMDAETSLHSLQQNFDAQQRNLWKLRDLRKSEDKESMLLYLKSNTGRKQTYHQGEETSL